MQNGKEKLKMRFFAGAQYSRVLFGNQKILVKSQNLLIRWAVDLHHACRGKQSGFQSVTRLPGFTHQTHRMDSINNRQNKNNPEITSEIVFSSPWSAVLPLENRILSIASAC